MQDLSLFVRYNTQHAKESLILVYSIFHGYDHARLW